MITLKPGVFRVSFADTGLVSPIQTCSLNPGFLDPLFGRGSLFTETNITFCTESQLNLTKGLRELQPA